jgi:prophage antirepressor-like protein
MNTELKVFSHEKFGEIRTMTDENGETLFVGNDVARALGYVNPRKALQYLNQRLMSSDAITPKVVQLNLFFN